MKTFAVLLFAVLSRKFNVRADTIRGSTAEGADVLQSLGRVVSKQAQALPLTFPPATVDPLPFVASEAPTPLLPAEVQASSHVIQWGSAKNGCNYSLPPITVSCGAGGTIALGQISSTVKGCIARNSSALVCSSIVTPSTNPQLTVTCSGTTTSQLAVSVGISVSQTTCNNLLGVFPQSKSIVRGGAVSVLALLGRYCKNSNGMLYLNTNYTCGTEDKTVAQAGIRFCTADTSCSTRLPCNSTTPAQSCPGSCINKLAAVTVSDEDTRADCINVGPRSTPLPAGLHSITWSSFHPRCSAADSTIVASCGYGGLIAFASSSLSKCTAVGDGLSCTKNATTSSASVVFYCYGTTDTARTATAFLSKSNVTNCTAVAAKTVNLASQSVNLQRFCGNGTLIPRPSRVCGKASQLVLSKPGNTTFCTASNACNSTANSSCSIPLDFVSMSDTFADPTCNVRGPKSLYF